MLPKTTKPGMSAVQLADIRRRHNLTYLQTAHMLGVAVLTVKRWQGTNADYRQMPFAASELLLTLVGEHPQFGERKPYQPPQKPQELEAQTPPGEPAPTPEEIASMLREVIRHLESDTTT